MVEKSNSGCVKMSKCFVSNVINLLKKICHLSVCENYLLFLN